jgi:glycosyltransferase involved in cell wall biosynthesis
MARWKAVNWTRYHSLLSSLADKGHEVLVLQTPSRRSDETNFIEIDVVLPKSLTVVDIRIPGWFWNTTFPLDKLVKKGIYSILSFLTARRLISKENFDIVLLYNIPHYPFLNLKGPRKIFDYADDYLSMLDRELGRFSNRFVMGFARRLLDRIIKRSDLVLAVSNVLAENMEGRVKVLPNGVSPKKMEAARSRPVKLKLPRPIVGFIGSFEYFIDFDLILDVAKNMPKIKFLLVGKGRDWEMVRGRITNIGLTNVTLLGAVPHEEVFAYIDLMDICLNIFRKGPVADAACPIKLFEYMIMGKPVISTRLREVEIIDKGFLFYGDDAAEVTNAIQEILTWSPDVKEKIALGQQVANTHYTWDGIADRFCRLVEEIESGMK